MLNQSVWAMEAYFCLRYPLYLIIATLLLIFVTQCEFFIVNFISQLQLLFVILYLRWKRSSKRTELAMHKKLLHLATYQNTLATV